MKPKVYLEKTGLWSKPAMMAQVVYEAMMDEGRSRINVDRSYAKEWSNKAIVFFNNADFSDVDELVRFASEFVDIDWGKAPKKGRHDEEEPLAVIAVPSAPPAAEVTNQLVIIPVKRGRGRPRKNPEAANRLVRNMERKS